MSLKFQNTSDFFLLFIIFVKVVFAISAVGHFILTHVQNSNIKNKIDTKFMYWKERTEFIFIASMSVLLIYYFKPGKRVSMDSETTLLFFLFGWVLLLTAKWDLFFKEARWYKLFADQLK
jgi:hypothetical protein